MPREWEPDVRSRDIPTADAIRALGSHLAEFDPSAVEAYLTLAIVAGEMQARLESVISEHGLSRARFVSLILLRKAGTPLTPAELAHRSSTTTASIASLLEGLVTAGLIRREPRQDDRRSHYVHLTDAGNAKLDAVLPVVYGTMAKMMAPLGNDAREDFVRVLLGLRDGQQP